MSKIKKILVALLSLALILGVSGCGSKSDKTYKIGVIQLVQHEALDKSYTGFTDALKDKGYEDGKNIKIDYQNAAGDQSNCQTISDSFVNDKKDLVLAIATPAAQAIANKTQDIPILVTAVTDPKEAGLVKSNEKPETNVSGTSDLNPIKEQIKLLKDFCPDAKKIAIIYCSNEANSIYQAKLAKKEAEKLGLKVINATVSNSNEIQQVTKNAASKVDAIYAPTDNMISAGMATVSQIANEAKIPVICGESSQVDNGGLATYGIDYYKLGYKTGEQAVKVLEGKAKISEMPIEYLSDDDLTLAVNNDTAKAIGIKIPSDIQKKLDAQK